MRAVRPLPTLASAALLAVLAAGSGWAAEAPVRLVVFESFMRFG